MKLTHLCFADDLLLFSDASIQTINVVKAVLIEFEKLFWIESKFFQKFFFLFWFIFQNEGFIAGCSSDERRDTSCPIPGGAFNIF
jgi:hypothetical protein